MFSLMHVNMCFSQSRFKVLLTNSIFMTSAVTKKTFSKDEVPKHIIKAYVHRF